MNSITTDDKFMESEYKRFQTMLKQAGKKWGGQEQQIEGY
jgi:hypothetical protein